MTRLLRFIVARLALRVRYGVSMGIATRKTLNFPWLRMAFGLVQALAIIVLALGICAGFIWVFLNPLLPSSFSSVPVAKVLIFAGMGGSFFTLVVWGFYLVKESHHKIRTNPRHFHALRNDFELRRQALSHATELDRVLPITPSTPRPRL